MRSTIFAAGCAIVALLAAAPAFAETMQFKADLAAANEVPPTGTGATGHLTASYDTMTKELDYKVDYTGLTGPAAAAHFHGPAPKSENSGVMIPLAGALDSPIEGKATLTDAQAKALTGGMMYFNIHTAAHKNGELRGQLQAGM